MIKYRSLYWNLCSSVTVSHQRNCKFQDVRINILSLDLWWLEMKLFCHVLNFKDFMYLTLITQIIRIDGFTVVKLMLLQLSHLAIDQTFNEKVF